MAKEDYLFRQFDLFSRVIGKVIADFIGKTSNEDVLEIDRIKEIVKSELDLDLDELFDIENEEELTTLLLETKKISFESLEKLVELFIEIGDKNNAKKIFHHCKKINLNIFSHKTKWKKVKKLSDMPFSYHDGLVFLSKKNQLKI